jgi:MYXO-CTERM domain-containing protein
VDQYADFIAANGQGPLTVTITAPADGAILPPDFTVSVTAESDAGVARVELSLDGTVVGSLAAPPWNIALTGVATGDHMITVSGTAADFVTATDSVTITVEPQDTPPDASGPSDDGGSHFTPPEPSDGGCRVIGGPRQPGALSLLVLALLALALRRRRHLYGRP